MQTKNIHFFILVLFSPFSILQTQNKIIVYPQEYPYALKNPLRISGQMPLAKTAKTTLLYNHYEIILNGMK
jgi:hypothetical protein